MSKKTSKILKSILVRLIITVFVITIIIAGFFYIKQRNNTTDDDEPEPQKDIHVEFLLEIYNKIQENYWEEISDEDLIELFELAIDKFQTQTATNTQESAITVSDNDIASILSQKIESIQIEERKEFSVNVGTTVLANLKPFGRSGLYTSENVQELSDTVQNIDPDADLYSELELEKDATEEEIKESQEEKSKNLEEIINDETKTEEEIKEAEEKIALLDRAYETLSEPKDREKYDESGIESTASSNIIKPGIAYLQIKKFSPTTFEEFANELDGLEDEPGLESLIIDFRDNIGGSIDYLPYFLGVFLGNNQHAYDWYHQEDYLPFRTKAERMPATKKVKNTIILANEITQSSAELMISTLKKFNIGTFIGTKTKGWGTIEKVYPLDIQIDPVKETYSIFLVHSVTLRDTDGQPIEGRGVDPDIDITTEDWQDQLSDYFEDRDLIEVIEELLEK